MVKLLLCSGAKPNTADNKGKTPLNWAASNGCTDVVKLLLDARADPNKPNRNGRDTPLYWADFYGHKDVVKLLLDAGAKSHVADDRGKHPQSG